LWNFEEKWSSIIFSDETHEVLGTNQKVYVWRIADEKWRPGCLGIRAPRHGSSRVSFSFWGCICATSVGTLTPSDENVKSSKYIELIDQYLLPLVAKHFQNNDWIFQEDNCPAHVSKQTQDRKA
jgi:hypothetical protein